MYRTSEGVSAKASIALPYPPAANRYWRSVAGRVLVSREAREYKHAAALMALAAGVRPLDGEVAVSLHIYRPRKSGDLDGRIKVTLDALNGIAWRDDSQVAELHAYRHEDKTHPRAEVTVSPAGERNTAG